MNKKNSHCSFCGQVFHSKNEWPKTCGNCNNTTWLNPIPVAVVMVPVIDSEHDDAGLLLVRRSIEPCKGELAFPGGYLNNGETWQVGAARELLEETGIGTDPTTIFCWEPVTASNGNLLIFCQTESILEKDIHFKKNDEVDELIVTREAISLCFPTHTRMLKRYFEYKNL